MNSNKQHTNEETNKLQTQTANKKQQKQQQQRTSNKAYKQNSIDNKQNKENKTWNSNKHHINTETN